MKKGGGLSHGELTYVMSASFRLTWVNALRPSFRIVVLFRSGKKCGADALEKASGTAAA